MAVSHPSSRIEARAPVRPAVLLLAAALAALGGCSHEEPIRRDIFLLVVDTLRADHLGLYGYGRSTSRNLDRFAESAIVFEDVVAPSSWTLPSVGSLMTGCYPSAHGLCAKGGETLTALRPAAVTLAEVLREAGYRTVAVVSNPWILNEANGLARGFEDYRAAPMALAAEVNAIAREIVESEDPRPLCLYVHYMDPHGPYDRHPLVPHAMLGRLPEELDRALTPKELSTLPLYLRLKRSQELGAYVDAYDSSIHAWDVAFGQWCEWLATRAGPEPVVLVTADHGEEFVDHGGWNHGETLYREQLRVPWVMRVPGFPAQRIADQVVSGIDVAPTLLSAVGLEIPTTMTGWNAIAEREGWQRDVFAETDVRIGGVLDADYRQRSVRRGSLKWIEGPTGEECFDLASDPRERDAHCSDGEWSRLASLALERWEQETAELVEELGPTTSVELSEDQQEELRALGYVK